MDGILDSPAVAVGAGGAAPPAGASALAVTVIGAGYVGLVTGTCLAAIGHRVVLVDRDAARIASLRAGRAPIFEPGLAPLMAEAVAAGRLGFEAAAPGAAAAADAVFVCVGTPPSPLDGQADTGAVFSAVAEAARAARRGAVLVIKSTVPVGTGDEAEALVAALRPDAGIAVVSNPEFLREGAAIADFMNPDRIVVGTGEARAARLMAALYRPLVAAGAPLMVTGRRTAELIKYAANCFLALKVTYINEIANLCEEVGADVEEVARGIGLDPRIGERFLKAGPGFGGSCFPKDMLALMRTAQDHGVPLRTVETAVAVNEARKGEMVRKIVRAAGGSVAGKTIAVLGLAFKAGTDDMRSAAALVVLPRLMKAGARLRAHDPAAMDEARRLLPGVEMAGSALEAARGADLAVLLTDWPDYAGLDLGALGAALRQPVLVDLRNLYDPGAAERAGLAYVPVGRPAREAAGPPAPDPQDRAFAQPCADFSAAACRTAAD